MKASELIKKIQEQIDISGEPDIEVLTEGDYAEWWSPKAKLQSWSEKNIILIKPDIK